jgi:hypothetical protein
MGNPRLAVCPGGMLLWQGSLEPQILRYAQDDRPSEAVGCGMLIVRRGESVAGEFGDAEVSAKVEQVERAKVAGQRYDVQIARAGLQYDHSGYVRALEFDEEVGMSFGADGVGSGCGRWGGVTLGAYQVLPSRSFVLLADGVQLPYVVHSGLGVFVEMDGYSVELGDRVAGVGISAIDEAAGHLQHGPVKGEVGMEGGGAAKLLDAGGDPVGRRRRRRRV